MIKINLEDLSPQTSFPAYFGKEKELSLVHYSTLTKDFEKKDNNSFIVELLISIAEKRASSIENILQYEINALRDLNTNISSLVCFNKINDFFTNASLETIIVFSSLAQGIPETKSNIHFKDEIIELSEMLENIVEEHTELYKEISNDDENLDKINENIYFLTSLLNTIKNYAFKNLKRIASEISSKMTFDEQMKVIGSLISINSFNNNSIPPQLEYKSAKKDDIIIEDAEVVEGNEENNSINNNSNNSDNFSCSFSIQEIKKYLIDTEKTLEDKINKLSLENQTLKESIKVLTETNSRFLSNFDAFMENQANIQKAIKEKYNINF